MISGIENLKDGYLEENFIKPEERCYLCGTSKSASSELYPAKIQYGKGSQSKDIWLCRMCYETLSEYAE